MSSLIVPIALIDDVRAHPNAERLEIAVIKGWQVVVGKGTYKPGDKVVYVPPDAVVPVEWSDRWDVTRYLSNGRVRCAKLRGEPSFGFAVSTAHLPEDGGPWDADANVAEAFGITKYEPPFAPQAEDAAPSHALFPAYTEIENMRNFPTVLRDGEEVVFTEKIHGTNARVGIVNGEPMGGSRGVRRKRPDDPASSLYWFPFTLLGVDALLQSLAARHRQVVLFGETYGKVQRLRYGLDKGVAFRAFDLLVDGRYLDWDRFTEVCVSFDVPTVPVVYRGPFTLDRAKAASEGHTLVSGSHYREGVVCHPVVERDDPRIGRVILKYVSDTYLLGGKDEPATEAAS